VSSINPSPSEVRRIVLTFRSGELVVHTLYGSKAPDSPTPNTKARLTEVTELTRQGLQDALKALEGGAECVGSSGFAQREDVRTSSPP
jgi:hypothetical protein